MATKTSTQPNKSIAGDIFNSPAVQQTIQALLLDLLTRVPGLLGGLFSKKPKKVVEEPEPAVPGTEDSDFPDDTIPPPPSTEDRKIASVRLKLARAQYNRQRFPDQYTAANPMGLYSSTDLRAIESGQGSLNYGSKFWLDLTAFDAAGKEFLRDAVLAAGLSYETEHHCGDAYIIGHGAAKDGSPKAGYETNDTDAIGNGITAWISSLGFLHQMKAFGEGTFHCSGKVDGVPSNEFDIRVS